MLRGEAAFGQVGINTPIPAVTLDIVAKSTDGSTSEGILIPKLTGDALHTADSNGQYGADHDSTLVFVIETPAPANKIEHTIVLFYWGYRRLQ